MHLDAGGEVGDGLVAGGVLGHDDDLLHPLGGELAGDLGDREAALGMLAAGHGDGVVVEQLVGDVAAHHHRGADGQRAGVIVGAVAQIDEHMRLAGERAGAGPAQALAAHVAGQVGLRVGEAGHVVAADPGQGAGPFGKPGRGVVRAAGAEERLPDLVGAQGHRRHAGGRDAGEIVVHPVHVRAGRQAVGDGQRHFGHRQRAQRREQRMAVLVDLADHLRLGVGGQVVERRAGLTLQQRALVLHHHQRLQPAGEGAQAGGLQRPGHADLVDGDAQVGGFRQADAHGRQRLHHVLVGLAVGGDAEAPARAAEDLPVDLVGAGEGQGGRDLEQPQAPLLVHRLVLEPDAEAAGGHGEPLGQAPLVPGEVDVDGGPGVHGVGQRDQPDPEAREARQRVAHQPVVQHLLHVGGGQHRHLEILEGVFRLRGQGGRLAGVVVAGHRQHPALGPGAGEVGVLERIAGAVDPGRLAVPHAEHAVVLGAGEQIGLLAAPDGGGREVFVQALLEDDVLGLQVLGRPVRLLVEAAQGRAAIARHEPRGAQSGAAVQSPLIQQDPDQRLNAGDENATILEQIFVVQGHFCMAHGKIFPAALLA